jgi:ribonuclease BN (tRNA processing enzyme)
MIPKHWAGLALGLALACTAASRSVQAQDSVSALQLLVLGSGGPAATGRAASSYLVLIDGVARILVDAGPGSFTRLGESGVSLEAADVVLLTHLHIDHVGELAGLFKSRAVSTSGPIRVDVWGPDGSAVNHASRVDPAGAYFPSTRRFVDLLFGPWGAFAYLRDFSAPLTIRPHDVAARLVPHATPRQLRNAGGVKITAIAGHHGDAPAVIYRIDHAGKSITFSGDIDAGGLPNLLTIARSTDLLVFNSVVLDPPGSPPVLYTLHSPPQAIGELANAAGVHALLLSHLSPATVQMHDAVLESIRKNYRGSVISAADGMRLSP